MAEDQVKIGKESSDFNQITRASDDSHYPYGTSLSFENDLIEELDVGGLAVGDVVEIHGFAFVDSKSEHSDKDGSNKSMRLQLTSVKIRREEGDRAQRLYGDT